MYNISSSVLLVLFVPGSAFIHKHTNPSKHTEALLGSNKSESEPKPELDSKSVSNENNTSETAEVHHNHESDTEVYYTCSMHPNVKEPKPGRCPICNMNLTKMVVEHDHDDDKDEEATKDQKNTEVIYQCKDFPDVTSTSPDTCPLDGTPMIKKEGESTSAKIIARVKLRKSQLKHFNPAIFPATTMKMTKKLRVLGRVKSAEEKKSNISARFPARVEKVFVESIGSQIKIGDPVVKVFSPELLTTGEELILLAQKSNSKSEFKQLYIKTREKLLLWGIRPFQINKWVKNKKVPRNVTLYANSSGVVRKRIAVPGKYLREGQNYFELSDLSLVWVEMDVYEHNSNLIKPGQSVSLNFVATPGKPKTGSIDFISPTINVKTQTLKIRTSIANKEGLLKPGMVAQGTINVSLDGNPIVVPTSAVIDTGTRKVVWIKNSSQKYIAQQIQTGFFSDGYTQVLKGVKESDKVVIEGNFMLDAQAQFFGGYEDFNSGDSINEKKHNH